MPNPAQSGWPAEYQVAGASISEVVPDQDHRRQAERRPPGLPRDQPAGQEHDGDQDRIRRDRQHLGKPLQAPRHGHETPGQQPPGRHDVRVVRHEQVRDRALPGPRGRHVGDVVTE